jgi:FlaA1/EpsC-like NDP-sugar epimerase
MHTLSFGQATRDKTSRIFNMTGALARIRWTADATDASMLLLLGEGCLAAVSYAIAVLLAAQGRGSGWAIEVLRRTLGAVIALRVGVSFGCRLYRRSLRYASALDVIAIAKVVGLSSLLLWLVVEELFYRLRIPGEVFTLDALTLLILWAGLHLGPRVWTVRRAASRKHGKRVVIVGAGDAGTSLLKELALDSASCWRPVAVVDDDRKKWGRKLYDVPIVGGTRNLAKIAAEKEADEVLICIPSASRGQMRDILNASRQANLPVRSLPSLSELMHDTGTGAVSRRDLRNPRIEDILQREEIRVDTEEARRVVGGKTVLVTGAGGSIGSELCRQIAAAGPRKLLLVDKSENSLFYVNLDASERLDSARVKPFLIDILDATRMRRILHREQPDIVFHAAAYKHVAMLELHPEEAIGNNVLGAWRLAEAALECGVGRFVNISTDKAVNPRSYMGLSKKISEMCIEELAARAKSGGAEAGAALTRFSNVRFGNVAGSTGSVLRLFWDQIQKGGPVRVTDPRATRYFMSVPEAVHLILRAAALGRGGETFVLDMGEPLNICEIARTMMLFAGLKPNEDLRVEFTGLQRGEKIREELWDEGEVPAPTESDRILVVRGDQARTRGALESALRMEEFLRIRDRDGLLSYLDEAFPDFAASRADDAREAPSVLATEIVAPACEGVA